MKYDAGLTIKTTHDVIEKQYPMKIWSEFLLMKNNFTVKVALECFASQRNNENKFTNLTSFLFIS